MVMILGRLLGVVDFLKNASQRQKIIGAFIFASIMAWLLVGLRAAGPFSSLELEEAAVSSPAAVVSDSLASGGSYVVFGSGSGNVISRIQAEDYMDGGEGTAYHD
ncbi:MAG: hypothetical protein R3313_00920, partial [Candidatus Saccharimonadales bacterium]|nr:hypothetical protein [Candidatus Saccharimonadales bacterium]